MSSNSERFGRYVHERRTALRLTQLEVAEAGGPSNTKQTEIEGGLLKKLTPGMAKKVDAGLQWEQGSAYDVWEGREPTPLGTEAEDRIRALGLEPEPEAEVLAILEADRSRRGMG